MVEQFDWQVLEGANGAALTFIRTNAHCWDHSEKQMERAWIPPDAASVGSGERLMLMNSLIDKKVPFIPAAGPNSKSITWYTCGPTVYDSAHLGHARNYLAFDIVRRVLEDYFGYSILYVMNITDVEDKIILRARRKHIMASYLEQEGSDPERLLQDCIEAVGLAVEKQRGKVDEAESEVEKTMAETDSTEKKKKLEGLQEAAEQEQLLYSKLASALETIRGMSAQSPQAEILNIAGDALAARLDEERKASVSDPEVFRAHAAHFENEFNEDMETLNVRPPTVLTRVSEYIPEIVEYIQGIVKNGMGYESNGSVYFDTQAFRGAGHTYGKLNPWAVGSALSAEGGPSGDKKHSSDFALWKAAKPGEPTWESPWGLGRPGWHIECSAMASSIIGSVVDIHTGGEDLRFPHHDNELAQAEGYYHCEGCSQWVNYFLHSGHLGIEGLKMSKSLKNFVTIREALQVFTPRQLRLMMALNPWDRRMAYGTQVQEEVKGRESQLKNFFDNVDVAMRASAKSTHCSQKWLPEEFELSKSLRNASESIHTSFLDSINTRGALDAVSELIKATNLYLSTRQGTDGPLPQPMLLRQCAACVTKTLSVMGLTPYTYDKLGMDSQGGNSESSKKTEMVLDTFTDFRDEIRSLAKSGATAGDYLKCCDRFRDERMVDIGVRLEDTPAGGSVWKLDDPEVLRKERDEKLAAIAVAARKKLQSKIESLQRDIAKFEKIEALPPPSVALAEKYSKFGEDGYPTHDKDGVELEGKAVDKAKKDIDKANKARLPYQKKVAELGPDFLNDMRLQLADLEKSFKEGV